MARDANPVSVLVPHALPAGEFHAGAPYYLHIWGTAEDQDPMSPIRLLIADDHSLFRRGLVSLFAAHREFEVIGEAENGEQALQKARLLKPDLILLDVRMPVLNGLEALRCIRAEQISARVVMLTASEDDKNIAEAMQQGAQGYILKTIEPDELFEQLHNVMSDKGTTAEPTPPK